MYKRILVPIDFSETSEEALRYAVKCKAAGTKEIILLHVIDPLDISSLGLVGMQQYEESLKTNLYREAEIKLNALREKYTTDEIILKSLVKEGKPFAEIIRTAIEEEVNIIIMGSHGKGITSEVLLGSTSEKVVRKSPVTVMIVKPEKVKEKLLKCWKTLGEK